MRDGETEVRSNAVIEISSQKGRRLRSMSVMVSASAIEPDFGSIVRPTHYEGARSFTAERFQRIDQRRAASGDKRGNGADERKHEACRDDSERIRADRTV
jgi:hypothetical protein